jgi:hypothetical protein
LWQVRKDILSTYGDRYEYIVPVHEPRKLLEDRFNLIGKDVAFGSKNPFARTTAVYVKNHRMYVSMTLEPWRCLDDKIEGLLKKDRLRLVATKGETDWNLSLRMGHVV